MAKKRYDRTKEDVGNILALEHINLAVTDQAMATTFYVMGLGLTRDPYMMVGLDSMWINAGQQQFHLPTDSAAAQVVPGHIGLVLPDLEALMHRLAAVERWLAGTEFAWSEADGYLEVSCPWGNRFQCYTPGPGLGGMALGVPYVEFLVAPGTAEGIARFYEEVLGASCAVTRDRKGMAARVNVGRDQSLIFTETSEAVREYDGHHLAVYLANFSGPYRFLNDRGLVTEETDEHQYRFQSIVHPEHGEGLFTLEHEVRSLRHPMYEREKVNRNPDQVLTAYAPGRDTLIGVGP
jgi:catechol 2,3-dioxygenase-like lactoylglutathione lyase family enzyme